MPLIFRNHPEPGAVDLVFGGVLGVSDANIEASATAILVPRDIVIVADLSGSYNDDSQFQKYASNDPERARPPPSSIIRCRAAMPGRKPPR